MPSNKLFKLSAIWLKINTPIDKKIKVFKNLSYILGRFLFYTLKIHVNPRWNPANHGHIFLNGFLYYSIYLSFPIIYTIGFPTRHPIFLQIRRYIMSDNSR